DFRLPAQHIRTHMNEALIFDQPCVPAGSRRIVGWLDRTLAIGDWMRRIGYVTVELARLGTARGVPRQLAIATEVEIANGSGARRPFIIRLPSVCAGLK